MCFIEVSHLISFTDLFAASFFNCLWCPKSYKRPKFSIIVVAAFDHSTDASFTAFCLSSHMDLNQIEYMFCEHFWFIYFWFIYLILHFWFILIHSFWFEFYDLLHSGFNFVSISSICIYLKNMSAVCYIFVTLAFALLRFSNVQQNLIQNPKSKLFYV